MAEADHRRGGRREAGEEAGHRQAQARTDRAPTLKLRATDRLTTA